MRRRPALLALLASLVAAGGCAVLPGGEGTPSPLGGTWTAVDVAGLAPAPLSEPRVQFTGDGRITGSTGCNDLQARFRVEAGAIAVEDLLTTKVACAGEVGAVELAFVRVLGGAERITVLGDGLVIEGPDGAIRFERAGG